MSTHGSSVRVSLTGSSLYFARWIACLAILAKARERVLASGPVFLCRGYLMKPDEIIKTAYEAEKETVFNDCARDKSGLSARTAIVNFHQRLDVALESVASQSGVPNACKKGCDYCCHFKVELGADEMFAIKHYVMSVFSAERREFVLEAARNSALQVSSLSQSGRIKTNIPCPFLLDHECSVYPVRPAMCRKMHSTDVRSCRQSWDNPDDVTIANKEQAVVSAIAMAAIMAAREGVSKAGFDDSIYDLSKVLVDALDNPKCEKRWSQGKKAFPGC